MDFSFSSSYGFFFSILYELVFISFNYPNILKFFVFSYTLFDYSITYIFELGFFIFILFYKKILSFFLHFP